MDKYDVIVIGAGVAGLSGAIRLAKEGRKVLLIEQHYQPGGYCTAFKRKGITFELPTQIPAAGPDDTAGPVMKGLGIYDKLEMTRLRDVISFGFPGLKIKLPDTWEETIAKLKEIFPGDEEGIDYFFSAAEKLAGNTAPPELVRQCLTTSVDDMLTDKIKDMRLRSCLGGLYSLGTSPKKAAIALPMMFWTMTYREGCYYPQGGFQGLANTMAEIFTDNKGTIKYRAKAQRIAIQGGRVSSVELADGTRVLAPVVLSASDARSTFLDLVGRDNLPQQFVETIARKKAGMSFVIVWLGLDVDPISYWDLRTMNFMHTVPSLADAFDLLMQGKFGERMSLVVHSAMDPDIAAGGHTLQLVSMAPYNCPGVDWKKDKPHVVQRMLTKAEELLPGLSSHILVQEAATPATFYRYTSNYMGSIGGWEIAPENVGAGALQNKTPVEGLYLAGQWVVGPGIVPCMISGWETAEKILGST